MNQTRESSDSDQIVDVNKPLTKVQVSKKATQNRPPKINGRPGKNTSTVVLNEEKNKATNKRGSLKLKENLDTSNKMKNKGQDSDRRSTKNMTEKSNSNSICSSTKNQPKL